MAKVLISSARGAEDVARKLSAALRDRGIATWLSAEDLELGDQIDQRLEYEITEADAYVIVDARPPGILDSAFDIILDPAHDIESQAILRATSRYPNKKVIPVLLGAYPSLMWRNWKGISADRGSFNSANVADRISSVLNKAGDNRAVLSVEDQRKRRERIDAIAENVEKIRIAEISESR